MSFLPPWSPRRPLLLAGLAAFVALEALAGWPAQARPLPQPTETPKLTPITEEPTELPTLEPTSPPTIEPFTPTPLLELPTLAPTATRTREAEEGPPVPTEEPTAIPARPTSTRRPTRTPRWEATVASTPLPTGALRVSVALHPAVPAPGQPCQVLIDLLNRNTATLSDVTLDVTVPPFAGLADASATAGEVALVGAVARWYLPSISAGSQARLTVEAMIMPATARSFDVCVMVLSSGAPLEHCSDFALVAVEASTEGGVGTAGIEGAAVQALPTAPPSGLLPTPVAGQVMLGWLLVLLGLVGLGAWLGLQRRGRDVAEDRPPTTEGEVL